MDAWFADACSMWPVAPATSSVASLRDERSDLVADVPLSQLPVVLVRPADSSHEAANLPHQIMLWFVARSRCQQVLRDGRFVIRPLLLGNCAPYQRPSATILAASLWGM